MHIVITLLYIVSALLLLLLFLVFFVLLVPFRYRLQGGYDSRPWFIFNIRCSPAFIFAGKWDEEEKKALKARIILFGIPIKIDPHKMWKKEEKEQLKANNKKKNGMAAITSILDKEFRRRGIKLVRDLINILKPDQFSIKGKIGFEEPHYTGWLAALINSINYSCQNTLIDLEPVFEGEYFDFEFMLRGRIRLGRMLTKVGWFFFVNRIRNYSIRSGGKSLKPVASIE